MKNKRHSVSHGVQVNEIEYIYEEAILYVFKRERVMRYLFYSKLYTNKTWTW